MHLFKLKDTARTEDEKVANSRFMSMWATFFDHGSSALLKWLL